MVTTQDVLTEEVVRTRMEDITQEDLVFQQVFRGLDATNIENDEMKIPRPEDVMGTPEAIPEGGEFPYDDEDYEKVSIDFTKWGDAIPLTREAQMDSNFDIAADLVNRMGRQMNEFLNEQAFHVLDSNLNEASPAGSSAQGDDSLFDFHDVVDARQVLQQESYNPDTLIVNTLAGADLLHSDEFLRATDLGDETVLNGQIGRVAGFDVVESNAGLMASDAAEGFLIDTDYYGYEATREGVSTNRHEDESRQTEFMQIWTRLGWTAMDSAAAVRVQA